MENSYANIEHSFNILVNSIVETGIEQSLLVIAGDIFEYKSYMYSDDIFVFKEMCKKLHDNGIKCAILPGNHDYNVNSELVKDKISLLVDNFSNIKCFN